jgi:flap endonuclease-1
MGLNISDIVASDPIDFKALNHKVVCVDAFNTLYQFLAIIRQPDGTPLRDSRGRVTSHLSGLMYRNAKLIAEGIKLAYVFDGKPLPLKYSTIKARQEIKIAAKKEWEEALKAGDLERARSKAQQTSKLTREMIAESKQLLGYMGIPHIQALDGCEGEAQAAHIARKGDCDYVGSQDFDTLLFGAPKLLRNLTVSGKRKLPRQQFYIDVVPEVMALDMTLGELGITREQLVDLGILVGTDFNPGIRGIGQKKGLKLIKEHGTLEKVLEAKDFEIENYQEIREVFLHPKVTDDYELNWPEPQLDKITEMLIDKFEFSEARVNSTIRKLAAAKEGEKQQSLDKWFS